MLILSAAQACKPKFMKYGYFVLGIVILVSIGQFIADFQWYSVKPELRPPSPRWRPDDPVRHFRVQVLRGNVVTIQSEDLFFKIKRSLTDPNRCSQDS